MPNDIADATSLSTKATKALETLRAVATHAATHAAQCRHGADLAERSAPTVGALSSCRLPTECSNSGPCQKAANSIASGHGVSPLDRRAAEIGALLRHHHNGTRLGSRDCCSERVPPEIFSAVL